MCVRDAGVWFIEALGTAHVGVAAGAFEPITWYVRCAIYHDRFVSTFQLGPWSHVGGWTLGIVITACYTAGHWLWSYHPDLRPGGGGGGSVAVPVGGGGQIEMLPEELPGARRPRETMLT
jgi:hypothetical protein